MSEAMSPDSIEMKKQQLLLRKSQISEQNNYLSCSISEKPQLSLFDLTETSYIAQNCEDLLNSVLIASTLPETDEIRQIKKSINQMQIISKKDENTMTEKKCCNFTENQVNVIVPLIKNVDIKQIIRVLGNEILEKIDQLQVNVQNITEVEIEGVVDCIECQQSQFVILFQNVVQQWENGQFQKEIIINQIQSYQKRNNLLYIGTQHGIIYLIDLEQFNILEYTTIDSVSIQQIMVPFVVSDYGMIYNLNTKQKEQIPFQTEGIRLRRKCLIQDNNSILVFEQNNRIWCYKQGSQANIQHKYENNLFTHIIKCWRADDSIIVRDNLGSYRKYLVPSNLKHGDLITQEVQNFSYMEEERVIWEVCGIRVIRK